MELQDIPKNAAIATFAGGCFWCMETAYDGRKGVYEAFSGFTGGEEADAEYNKVATGRTQHREATQVYFNPAEITYQELLDVFWQQIDPTDKGGQFADRGHQYSTAIYTHNAEQKALAEASKKALAESGKFKAPIVTEILDAESFFFAPEEHQNFAQKRRAYYQMYKEGSGRAAFIQENWGKDRD